MAGGAKAESPSMLVLLNFNGAVDPLSARPKAGAGDVVVAQENLPYHAIDAGWFDLSVIPNDGDGLEGVEWQIFIVSNADVRDRHLFIDGVIFLPFDRDKPLFDDEFQLLMPTSMRRSISPFTSLREPSKARTTVLLERTRLRSTFICFKVVTVYGPECGLSSGAALRAFGSRSLVGTSTFPRGRVADMRERRSRHLSFYDPKVEGG
ncbi:hypothetical protein CRG98_008990 [Punica granatum]|uniref:Uncharacterized protein n=1 Tax=Punica granatum TaxID=22663 RepID=A0A2I0KRZ8_PUNGR|nr:hypothetical protein CRG98_008990 [Punica granatum]